MKASLRGIPRIPGIVCFAALAALGGCGDSAPGDEIVARAAGYELSVDQTADLLARQAQLPDQPDVVEAIASLWIDYTLFAVAALEDSTFQHIDLLPLVREEIEQELVARLRERVIQVDTAFTEEQLRQIYEEQAAGVELRARHILLSLDPGADAATADSVMEFAGGLRERILAGEDFAALAGELSQDPGTATQGGDLGSFRRGQMVPAFDSAAFALAPGEVSGPVRTGFGVHILRVDERTQVPFEEARSQFEPQLKLGLVSQAEEAYLGRVLSRAEMEPVEGGAEIARQLAARPSQRLSRRAAARELFRFEGGAYTASDFHRFLSEQGPPFRAQARNATDDQLIGLLGNLAQSKVLVNEAEQAGISLSDVEQDSLLMVARTRFTRAARDLELTSLTPAEGESMRDAVEAIVRGVMQRIVDGDENIPALGLN
ncbi:MAG: peptidylprolyl isomerase [Gammaproteobacteria bacterium]|nr:peptidylprolyl isomerase [Gammaproteobacteria bacterium]